MICHESELDFFIEHFRSFTAFEVKKCTGTTLHERNLSTILSLDAVNC